MTDTLNTIVINAIEGLKGQNQAVLDLTGLSSVMDTLMIVSGTSSRHVKSLASHLVESSKQAGFRPIGVEGMEAADWVLVDYGSLVVHIMLPETREFYALEKLWAPIAGHDTADHRDASD